MLVARSSLLLLCHAGADSTLRWEDNIAATCIRDLVYLYGMGLVASMSATKGRPLSPAAKGAMYSPAYGLSGSESRPGTMSPFELAQRPIMPTIAKRPLLISARSLVSFFSGVSLAVNLNGSKSSSGTCRVAAQIRESENRSMSI